MRMCMCCRLYGRLWAVWARRTAVSLSADDPLALTLTHVGIRQ